MKNLTRQWGGRFSYAFIRWFILWIVAIGNIFPLSAQKAKKIEGSYTYYTPENVSIEQAKQIALERAKLSALANAFGTSLSQQNFTHLNNRNEKNELNFQSISSSEVKGEWIETLGEPKYSIRYEQEMLVVFCKVKGKAREIISSDVDLQVKILRNGTNTHFESTDFREGDDLYLAFQSPVKGYLAIYLLDEESAYCLLPYQRQSEGIYPIQANAPYLFFSIKEASKEEKNVVDEYVLKTEKLQETNQIYLFFSSNLFYKANDNDRGKGLPRELNENDFMKWRAKIKRKDSKLKEVVQAITIRKR